MVWKQDKGAVLDMEMQQHCQPEFSVHVSKDEGIYYETCILNIWLQNRMKPAIIHTVDQLSARAQKRVSYRSRQSHTVCVREEQ